MSKTLIIVRHGNTFLPDQTPTRVGAQTDLPLVEEQRARAVGRYLTEHNLTPDKIYAAPLKRTMGTAELIIDQMKLKLEITPDHNFTEIDYGPDENCTEEQVELRLGREAIERGNLKSHHNSSVDECIKQGREIIELWNSEAVVPSGWSVDVERIIASWRELADSIEDGKTALISTSNGIIRFAPHILDREYSEFRQQHNLKVSTGSVSIFRFENKKWQCQEWGVKPTSINSKLDQ